jgi:hypothetical protein
MTRREIKFALEVEKVLNQLSEPEYREVVVEVSVFSKHLFSFIKLNPQNLGPHTPWPTSSSHYGRTKNPY